LVAVVVENFIEMVAVVVEDISALVTMMGGVITEELEEVVEDITEL
jgi:hypothetical protein